MLKPAIPVYDIANSPSQNIQGYIRHRGTFALYRLFIWVLDILTLTIPKRIYYTMVRRRLAANFKRNEETNKRIRKEAEASFKRFWQDRLSDPVLGEMAKYTLRDHCQ